MMQNLTNYLKKWLETSTPRQKLIVALLLFSLLATGALFALGGSSGTSTDPLDSTPFYFLGVFVKLLGVLLLIVASGIILRRWVGVNPAARPDRRLRLLETIRLSPRQSLHLVAIGEQQILIGATDQSVALITHVESSLDENPTEALPPQSGLNFSSVLQAFNSSLPTDSHKVKE